MANISPRSRYLQVPVVKRRIYKEGSNGVDGPIREDRVFGRRYTSYADVPNSLRYELQHGDTYASLAYRFYGDPNLWHVIADFNPRAFNPIELKTGQTIIIPPLAEVASRSR